MSVYRQEGRWMVEVAWRHADGRRERVRRRSPVNTKAGAQKYETQLRAALLDGSFARPVVPTLGEFSADYLAYSATNNRARTHREKVATFRRALVPFFGAKRLDSIGFRDFEEYKAARVAAGLHAKTINDELALVVAALRLAVKYKIIATAPTFERLRLPPPTFDFLTFAEADRLVAAADEYPWATMILVALRTGLRRSELRALQWTDIDLDAGRITVNRAFDDRGAIVPPKNGRAREVPLSDDVVEDLRLHGTGADAPWVFGSPAPFTQRQMERPIERACKRAGLRSVGWHALRHTFASHLVMRGVSLKAIQELGGWSSLTMVLRYAHLAPDARRDAVQLLDARTRTT